MFLEGPLVGQCPVLYITWMIGFGKYTLGALYDRDARLLHDNCASLLYQGSDSLWIYTRDAAVSFTWPVFELWTNDTDSNPAKIVMKYDIPTFLFFVFFLQRFKFYLRAIFRLFFSKL